MLTAFQSAILGVDLVTFYLLLVVSAISLIALGFVWCHSHGVRRGLFVFLARVCWLVPVFSLLFFVEQRSSLDSDILDKRIRVLLDDSASMAGPGKAGQTKSVLETVEREAAAKGYRLEKILLSELSGRTDYSDLGLFRDQLSQKQSSHPWVLVSDGGAADIEYAYSNAILSKESSETGNRSAGLIVGVGSRNFSNIWIESIEPLGFVFEEQGFSLRVTLGRTSNAPLQSQVHVKNGNDFLGSSIAYFATGESSVTIDVPVKQVTKGTHKLLVQIPAYGSERQIVDNKAFAVVESLTNTLGVLHLLGEPSWDGRFMRKFLKDEPKFDRISFFILRDVEDRVQAADEELSLIPFPAERLFTKELPNFKLLVVQNFDMQRFLRPSYQENLVKFVENGGSLLFMGGARALARAELRSGPLKNILPFASDDMRAADKKLSASFGRRSLFNNFSGGKTYSTDQTFSVDINQSRASAAATDILFQGLRKNLSILTNTTGWKGLHHLSSKAKLQHGGEVLLTAKTPQGDSPLLVASYPGKGRALWLMTDSAWRTAFASTAEVGPHTYARFMKTLFDWLLKNSSEERLAISDAMIIDQGEGGKRLQAVLKGYQATALAGDASKWKQAWSVCGVGISPKNLNKKPLPGGKYLLAANIKADFSAKEDCSLQLQAISPGSEHIELVFPVQIARVRGDKEVQESQKVLKAYSREFGAKLVVSSARQQEALGSWMENNLSEQNLAGSTPEKIENSYFWFFDQDYAWLFFLAFPLEVFLRRRKEIGW